jgi:hypothetical protein
VVQGGCCGPGEEEGSMSVWMMLVFVSWKSVFKPQAFAPRMPTRPTGHRRLRLHAKEPHTLVGRETYTQGTYIFPIGLSMLSPIADK